MSEDQAIVPESTPQAAMPDGYEKIESGANNWTEQLHDNFAALAQGMGDNEAVNEKLEDIGRNLGIRLDEMQVSMEQSLADKVGRKEFEASQQKQDAEIMLLKASMNTGFAGTTFSFGFAPHEIHHWQGYDGGAPEGAVNSSNQLTN